MCTSWINFLPAQKKAVTSVELHKGVDGKTQRAQEAEIGMLLNYELGSGAVGLRMCLLVA